MALSRFAPTGYVLSVTHSSTLTFATNHAHSVAPGRRVAMIRSRGRPDHSRRSLPVEIMGYEKWRVVDTRLSGDFRISSKSPWIAEHVRVARDPAPGQAP